MVRATTLHHATRMFDPPTPFAVASLCAILVIPRPSPSNTEAAWSVQPHSIMRLECLPRPLPSPLPLCAPSLSFLVPLHPTQKQHGPCNHTPSCDSNVCPAHSLRRCLSVRHPCHSSSLSIQHRSSMVRATTLH